MHAADIIIEKLQEHVKSLINLKYLEIREIIDGEGEIKLSFSATITDRETDPGEHAEKSDRIKTTLSFSIRSTATVESQLNEHPELPFPLNGPVHTPDSSIPIHDDDGHEIAHDVNLSSPAAENAGKTKLGDMLDQAASKLDQPLIHMAIDEPGWNFGGLRTEFRIKATKAKWTKAAISLMLDLLDQCDGNVDRAKETLRPHAIRTIKTEFSSDKEAIGV
jgi:hypothetical protein